MTSKYAPIKPLLDTDAYKLDHRRQYPKGTTRVLSNFTNRGSRIDYVDHVVHFGLQAFLQSWAIDAWQPFFDADPYEIEKLYYDFVASVLGPESADEIGTDHVVALHDLGYLPLEFRSLPEGALVPLRVPSFVVENTHPDFYWLVNYIETAMSAAIWQPSTSATKAYYFRKMLDDWALQTTGSKAGVQWQGHDFSFRGMAGIEAAAASGAGHLLSFTGSDNLHAVEWIGNNYPGDNELILGSVPATEHSVMCAGGSSREEEQATFERILKLYPSGIVSVVSDTWDLWAVITKILPALKDQILGRDGKLVIRPDSGNPVDILCGTKTRGAVSAEEVGVIELLWNLFGGEVNELGYKVLDSHIGAIYGDGITYERAQEICSRLAAKRFASTNVVFGVGSFTYQYTTRDDFMSAMKATWVRVNGEGQAIFKDPKTDSGTKKSARGRIAVVKNDDGEYTLLDGAIGSHLEKTEANLLKPVWRDGKFVDQQSFQEVRENLGAL